ncbi:MAG: hypothetical protein PHH30_04885 [Bacteroidales bacterium]|nr:hypothetical protein [Bacteroidales bacterium]
MNKYFKIALSCFCIYVFISCSSIRFPENEYHIFTGKSEWTATEKHCCNLAISNLPSADSTYIVFKKAKIKSMGQAQPMIRTILKNRQDRIYIISVRDKKVNPNLCFETIPDSAKIGLVGHEIVHVLDFKSKSFPEIIVMGLKYSFSHKYKRNVEWITDSLTIANNMGYENLCFSNYIYNSPFVSKKYLKKKAKYYMTPDDMRNIIYTLSQLRTEQDTMPDNQILH